MKATPLQNEIIDICIAELQCWKDSNDIHSPTHNSEGSVELCKLYWDDKLPSTYCDEINDILQELRLTILRLTRLQELKESRLKYLNVK